MRILVLATLCMFGFGAAQVSLADLACQASMFQCVKFTGKAYGDAKNNKAQTDAQQTCGGMPADATTSCDTSGAACKYNAGKDNEYIAYTAGGMAAAAEGSCKQKGGVFTAAAGGAAKPATGDSKKAADTKQPGEGKAHHPHHGGQDAKKSGATDSKAGAPDNKTGN